MVLRKTDNKQENKFDPKIVVNAMKTIESSSEQGV